ncbi:MAG TPA: right-handed parallel beta-helix repeat-containing protein [Desulfobulbus sp.]|nr:right-handed parallel beta-helix repeat-containing protein [Desulfobulbus sp.]
MKIKKTVFERSKLFHLMFSLVFLLLLTSPALAANIYVDDDACPWNGSGTSGDPYCSIADAISSASPGDDVLVYPGNYSERIYMKTGVDLRSAQATRPVILPVKKTFVKFYGVDDCTLDGFTIDASSAGMWSNAAIIRVYDGSNNITISNCDIKGSPSYSKTGIRVNGQVSVNIIGNTISNSRYAGITTQYAGTVTNSTIVIQGNTIQGNGTAGIYLRGYNDTANNRITIGGSGINDGNLITGNGTGADDKGSGIRLYHIDQLSIENNTIQGNRRAGILLLDTSSVSPHITNNSIHDNTESGINIGGASTLTIGSGNDIYSNGTAGITFFTFQNSKYTVNPSSLPVLITGNNIYLNGRAGISVLEWVSGVITIDGNNIYQNAKSGIAFFKNCTAIITDNDIHTHPDVAGISTGDWSGIYPPDPDNPPSSVAFDRFRGPVDLTIRRNKIHGNLCGMRLDHASGVITNNLVYNNSRSGIRFSGDTSDPYEPFPFIDVWGITEISNNTVVDNGSYIAGLGQYRGGGIIYDDINTTTDPNTGLARNFYDPPLKNDTQLPRIIKNNIAAYNMKAGIRDAVCAEGPDYKRDYNLYYGNFYGDHPEQPPTYIPFQTGGCFYLGFKGAKTANPHEIFADPLFVDRGAADYRIQTASPAKNSGDDGNDMGAYGGSDPITW